MLVFPAPGAAQEFVQAHLVGSKLVFGVADTSPVKIDWEALARAIPLEFDLESPPPGHPAERFSEDQNHKHLSFEHGELPVEGWFGFYALYGFVACVLLVLVAKQLRKILMRDEDYYDR